MGNKTLYLIYKIEIGNQLVHKACSFGCCDLCKFLLFDLNINSNHLKISIMSFSAEKRRRGRKGWDLRRLMKPLQSVPEIFYTQGISFGEVFMSYPASACLMELQPSSISSLRRSGNCRVNSCYKSGYVSHCTILEYEDPYTSQAFGFFLASCFILYFSINHL